MAQWFDLAIQSFTFLSVFAVASMAQRAIGAQLTVRRRLGREEITGPGTLSRTVPRGSELRRSTASRAACASASIDCA